MAHHWADDPSVTLTDDQLRTLHDLRHDPHPETPEHVGLRMDVHP